MSSPSMSTIPFIMSRFWYFQQSLRMNTKHPWNIPIIRLPFWISVNARIISFTVIRRVRTAFISYTDCQKRIRIIMRSRDIRLPALIPSVSFRSKKKTFRKYHRIGYFTEGFLSIISNIPHYYRKVSLLKIGLTVQ